MKEKATHLRPHTITQKILAAVLLISSFVTLFITFFQLYFDYTQEINSIKKSLTLVERSYSKSVAASLWELNEAQVKTQLDGITSIPGIQHVEIVYRGRKIYEAGKSVDNTIEKSIDLEYSNQSEDVYLGTLIIHGSKDQVLAKLKNKIFVIFISQFIKTFLVSVLLFLFIQHLLTRHLIHIASFVKNIDIKSNEQLQLEKNLCLNGKDELTSLVFSINEMRHKIYNSYLQMEETNIEQRRQLEISSRMSSLGEMAGGIAHEINNPLTIIGTSSKLLRKTIEKGDSSPERLSGYFEKIDKTTDRITKIINGMLALSRDASSEELTDFTWNEIINDVISLCGEKFKHAGIEIRIPDNECLHQSFQSRKIQLSQVLLNLLHNSYDAIAVLPEKWIQIDCSIENDEMIIAVTDSGKGIPLELHDKIMQPFFTTKDAGKGTGLGLSLSMTIVKKHNGQFYIDRKSQNTSFVIRLPMPLKVIK